MRRYLALVALLAMGAAEAPPAWLFPFNPPSKTPPKYDTVVKRGPPGSALKLTEAQNRDLFHTADWYPTDHPPMPLAVREGRPPDQYACGTCHLPNGGGRPENASLAGLQASYIVAEVKAFASGARGDGAHRPVIMQKIAKAVPADQLAAAARYFASIKPHRFGRVVETVNIPHVTSNPGPWHYTGAKGTEPLGGRLIEVPDDFERHEMRDSRLSYTAYVPAGSIARGKDLAQHWAKGAYACATCHGASYQGGIGPRLAGRSPSYLARQIYNFKSGARGGAASAQMAAVTRDMTINDMVALAAFMGNSAP
ncbi:MAG: c-type cytochrome [Sphingomonas sp.]